LLLQQALFLPCTFIESMQARGGVNFDVLDSLVEENLLAEGVVEVSDKHMLRSITTQDCSRLSDYTVSLTPNVY
jgi:hypothetical protein